MGRRRAGGLVEATGEGRATLIGAVTRGGAHPTDWYRIDGYVTVTVPNSRSESPFTGTDWEGVGVQPDIVVAEGDALEAALKESRPPGRRRTVTGAASQAVAPEE